MRTSLMTGMSAELKEAIGVWAQSHNVSVAEVVRKACAEYIGYNLEADEEAKVEKRGRPKVYANKEERRAASRERARKRRAVMRVVMEDFNKQDEATRREKFAAAVNRLPE